MQTMTTILNAVGAAPRVGLGLFFLLISSAIQLCTYWIGFWMLFSIWSFELQQLKHRDYNAVNFVWNLPSFNEDTAFAAKIAAAVFFILVIFFRFWYTFQTQIDDESRQNTQRQYNGENAE